MAVDGLVGEAWVLVRPYTKDFAPTLKKEVGGSVAAIDAELAAGGGLIGPKTIKASEREAENAAARVGGKVRKKLDQIGHHAVSSGAGIFGGLAIAEAGKQVIDASTSFETAMAAVQSQTGQSDKAVKSLGDALLNTARSGQLMFKATDLGTAYAEVAGQLKLTEGHAIDNAHALEFMKASEAAAEASGGDLESTTAALAGTMQAFHFNIKDVNKEADTLYNVSRALNMPIDAVATAVNRLHVRLGAAAPTLADTGSLMVSFGKAGVTGERGLMIANYALQRLLGSTQDVGKKRKASAAQIQSALIAEQTATDTATKALHTYGGNSEQYVIATERQRLAQKRLQDLQKPAAEKMNKVSAMAKELGLSIYDSKGKFVGMADLIGQLAPKLDKMTEKQRTLALQTLFGSTAAQLMGSVIEQGVPGWNKSVGAVTRHGSAEKGAALQAHTLRGEMRTLTSQFDALAVEVGQKVIPPLTTAAGWLIKHKVAAEALAGVIGGVLTLAVTRYVGQLVWSTAKTAKEIAKQIAQWTGLSKKVEQTKADASAAGKSLGNAGAKAGTELETGAATASTEMEAGASTASGELAAGGGTAEGELAAGGATASGELAAGGATAEGELAAGGATAEGELAAGGAAAGAEGAAGGLGGIAAGAEAGGGFAAGGLAAGLGIGAAGIAAQIGTTEILKHTPAGHALLSGERSIAHLFGSHAGEASTHATTKATDIVAAMDAYAKDHHETEQQLMASKSQMADFRRSMGWSTPGAPAPGKPGWQSLLTGPTGADPAEIKRLMADQNGGTKQIASHTNETNAQLKHQTQVLERIDRSLARRTHGQVTQLPRFLAEEFRR